MTQIYIPTDIIYNIFLTLPYDDVINYCSINKNVNKICSNQSFWKDKYYQDFSQFFSLNELLPSNYNGSWRNEYQRKYYDKWTIFRKLALVLPNYIKDYVMYFNDPDYADLLILAILILPLKEAEKYIYFLDKHERDELIRVPKYLDSLLRNNLDHDEVEFHFWLMLQNLLKNSYTPEQIQNRIKQLSIS